MANLRPVWFEIQAFSIKSQDDRILAKFSVFFCVFGERDFNKNAEKEERNQHQVMYKRNKLSQ